MDGAIVDGKGVGDDVVGDDEIGVGELVKTVGLFVGDCDGVIVGDNDVGDNDGVCVGDMDVGGGVVDGCGVGGQFSPEHV